MPKRKAVRKRASAKRSVKKAAVRRRGRTGPVAVGDAVRLPAETHNEINRYDPRLAGSARAADAIEGIVCSIREIRTGKLVGETKGSLSRFVLEILHAQTFRGQFSSERNVTGPAGDDVPTSSPIWLKLCGLLKEMAARGEFAVSGSGALSQEPFSALLDGWRVVKVKAEAIEPLD